MTFNGMSKGRESVIFSFDDNNSVNPSL